MRARTEQNVAVLDELVLNQEDKPQIHHSARSTTQFAVVWIIFSTAILA